MAVLYYLNQYFSTTLNVGGGIDSSQTEGIVLQSVSGIDTAKPGICCITYADPLVTSTAEWVTYTSIDGSNELQGVTRGAEGFAAKAHSNGATIVFPISRSHINNINNLLTGVTAGANLNEPTLTTGSNIQVNSADPTRAFYVPAYGMFGSTTNGAAIGQLESSSNKVNTKVLDFDKATDEHAHFCLPSPLNWNAGTVTAQVYWTSSAGSAEETVTWAIQGMSFANDDALDQAYGTAQTVADALIATGDVHVTSATDAITIGGTPTAGDWIQFRIYRDVSEDNLDADARLLGVRIAFTIGKYNDA